MSHDHSRAPSPTEQPRDNIIIVGCGRLGAELAVSLSQSYPHVTIIDSNPRAFEKLGPDFRGRTVQGEAVDLEVLKRADIDHAHGFAAVTSSDSVNVVTARAARDIFNVEHVVARIFNPRKGMIYEMLGLQTVATSSWGAERFKQILLHPGLRSVASAGNGDVQIYEFSVPGEWQGRPVSDVLPAGKAVAIALTRGGKTTLPGPAVELEEQDILQVSTTAAGVDALRKQLKLTGEK